MTALTTPLRLLQEVHRVLGDDPAQDDALVAASRAAVACAIHLVGAAARPSGMPASPDALAGAMEALGAVRIAVIAETFGIPAPPKPRSPMESLGVSPLSATRRREERAPGPGCRRGT